MGKGGDPSGTNDKKGGGSGRNEDTAQGYADTLAQQAQELYAAGVPTRAATYGILNSVLAGNRPAGMNFMGPEREAIEGQFTRAKENIIENTPARGGQMNQLLGQANIARAQAVSGLDSEVRRAALQGAMQAGFGTPGPAFGGQGAAANIFSGLNQQQISNIQSQNEKKGSMAGAGAGLGAAAIIASCWIAAAVYDDDPQLVHLARTWIFERWQGRTATLVRRLYRWCGPTVAPYVRRHAWMRTALEPLFERCIMRAA